MTAANQLDKSLASLLPKQLEAKDPALHSYYEEFKKNVTQKALLVLTETIPRKIKEYDELLPISGPPGAIVNVKDFPEDPMYHVANVDIESSDEERKEYVKPNGKRVKTDSFGGQMKLPQYIYSARTTTNQPVTDRVNKVKQDASELLELVASVKLWIQLNIPKIEDGNNFGVAIQEDVIQELARVEDAAFALRESTSKYFLQRAKIATKVVKYPNVEDYRIALRELDEKQWFQMKITNMDTRNNYAILYDMLHKVKPQCSSVVCVFRIGKR
eukprot:Protomagalhaensia_wolfi_Nauph_80__6064@NODE_84_length_3866_cov_229_538542_g64_i0_p3_GENE_NODE_84_length_3866_cov_229_538542_g64_i0NODE_84_length_3866_cov_229_538542_g64_i0_p3_ORF_typecomplete_len272_score55_95PA28_beta/PF02252_18/1_5e47PA28_alpha/PF02251_18/0_00013PA28_alpha/PF02251_18/6_6e03V_cholerae_RfbT/PF05575_11/0_032Ribosomal_L28/PF00830_19/6_6e03Ribosomal_L28/PF00830_19/1_3e04Ribosomal_L28/PF00830_19/0_1_NODE_84_length_3866_cov_229_538542_g64_i021312946